MLPGLYFFTKTKQLMFFKVNRWIGTFPQRHWHQSQIKVFSSDFLGQTLVQWKEKFWSTTPPPQMFWQSASCCLSALACRAHAVLLSDGRGGESSEIRAKSRTANTSNFSLAVSQTSQKQCISANSHSVFQANTKLFVLFLLIED